jgi:mRNA degradation ribonuclease J1/J2
MSVSQGKTMNFKIHRGTKEIGGSCVEVWTDTSRIVIDLGMPLVNPDQTPFDARETDNRSREELIQEGILPDIPSLYQDGSNTALLISHAHHAKHDEKFRIGDIQITPFQMDHAPFSWGL